MEQFGPRSNDPPDAVSCAELLIATIPVVMNAYRSEMRARRPDEVSIPQFRALIYLQRHDGITLSALAEHLGLAMSTTSQLIDGLQKRQLVAREVSCRDRRCALLSLTAQGNALLEDIRARVQRWLADRLADLPPDVCRAIAVAMPALHALFRHGPAETGENRTQPTSRRDVVADRSDA